MKIRKVVIENIKNFKDKRELELSNYNVFIGKNGTGKSNLAKSIFEAVDFPTNYGITLVPFQGDKSKVSYVSVDLLLNQADILFLTRSGAFSGLAQNQTNDQIRNDPIFSVSDQRELTVK